MNKTIRNLAALVAFVFGAAALSAQPAVKLLVVDMAKVLDSHYKTEEANAKFNDVRQKAQEQLDSMQKHLQEVADSYKELVEQYRNTVLKPEARSQAEADAQKKLEEIQRLQNQAQEFTVNTQRSLQQRIMTHKNLLFEEISKVVKDMATARGATLVLDKTGLTLVGVQAVIYSDPTFDITDDVIKEVNKDRPAAPVSATVPSSATTPPAAAPAKAAPEQFTVPNVTPEKKK